MQLSPDDEERLLDLIEGFEPLSGPERARRVKTLEEPLRRLVAMHFALPPTTVRLPSAVRALLSQQGISLDMRLDRPGAAAPERDDATALGDGRYEVIELLGEGGMGQVLEVEDLDLGRRIAAKVIRGHADRVALQKFVREGQITGQLEHPNIVPLYELGIGADGRLFFTMKKIEGRTLAELLHDTEARLAEPELLEILVKVGDAIAYAHSRGVIHRDLKPANVMVGAYGEVLVLDWGLVRLADGGEPLLPLRSADTSRFSKIATDRASRTRPGQIAGTPAYMPPEQAKGELDKLGPRSDVFALGAILYEMLTGRPPHSAHQVEAALQQAAAGRITPPRERAPERRIDRALAAIAMRALAADPDDRYADAVALTDDLRRHLAGHATLALPDNLARHAARWLARHRQLTLTLLLLSLLGGAGVTIWSLVRRGQLTREAHTRERRLTRVLGQIAHQGQRLDSHFVEFEGHLRTLAEGARLVLEGPAPARPRELRFVEDFRDGADRSRVPDLRPSPAYHLPISLDWPVVVPAPDVTREGSAASLQRLARVGDLFVRLFREGRWAPPQHRRKLRDQVDHSSGPLTWLIVALPEGIHFAYPGKGGYRKGYDPRQRNWYRKGLHADGPRWLAPYADELGQGILLPCVAPLRGADGRPLGVAGLELTLIDLQRQFMLPAGAPAIREAFLIAPPTRAHPPRRVMAHTLGPAAPTGAPAVKPASELARPALAAGLDTGEPLFELSMDGRRLLAVVHPLLSLDWSYVVLLDRDALGGQSSAGVR